MRRTETATVTVTLDVYASAYAEARGYVEDCLDRAEDVEYDAAVRALFDRGVEPLAAQTAVVVVLAELAGAALS